MLKCNAAGLANKVEQRRLVPAQADPAAINTAASPATETLQLRSMIGRTKSQLKTSDPGHHGHLGSPRLFFNSNSKLNDLPGDANFLKANVERGEDLDGNEGAGLEEGDWGDRVVKEDFRRENAEDFQR